VTADGFQPAGRAPAPAPLDLVQDFVNTEIPEWARDDLATPGDLEVWLRARGLLEANESVTADEYVAARELRAVLRTLALLNTVGEPPDEPVRRAFGSAVSRVSLRFELDDDGFICIEPTSEGGMRALGLIVASVADAQAAGAWKRMKACRKESCRWLFYDGSRNCSSSWCSMSICGNRFKTSAYRRRRRSAS
jgi:predicted RNA-binding Zn ribbon-like protein